MRPMAPPLRFWKSRASTTCSRVTLPILVRMRPMGRPFSSSILGGPAVAAAAAPGAAPAAPAAPGPPGAAGLAPAWTGAGPGPRPAAPPDVPAGGRDPGALVGGETLLAGCPAAVGGALAPSSGALGVVTFGRCAGMPGAPAEVVPPPPAPP